VSELRDRIYAILKEPQLAVLATITEDGKPWARYVMTVGAEDMTVRCATFITARKVSQIEKNPEVHVTCGTTSPTKPVPYLQIQARAQLNTSNKARHDFWTGMLSQIFAGPDDPQYGVLEMTPYRIEFCSPGAHQPEVWTAS